MDLQKMLKRRTTPDLQNAVASNELKNTMKSRLTAGTPSGGDYAQATKRRLQSLSRPQK